MIEMKTAKKAKHKEYDPENSSWSAGIRIMMTMKKNKNVNRAIRNKFTSQKSSHIAILLFGWLLLDTKPHMHLKNTERIPWIAIHPTNIIMALNAWIYSCSSIQLLVFTLGITHPLVYHYHVDNNRITLPDACIALCSLSLLFSISFFPFSVYGLKMDDFGWLCYDNCGLSTYLHKQFMMKKNEIRYTISILTFNMWKMCDAKFNYFPFIVQIRIEWSR